jgi:Ras-related protein Rab-1A
MDYDVAVKSIIIGDSGVGKSSLLYRYAEQDWNPHYIATIGVDFKVLTFERSNKVVKLQLWDTAGQERFRTITHSYYRGAHSIMMVFDITNRESFDNVAIWMHDVKKFANQNVPMLLVGNKADCAQHREVSSEEAEALAERLGCAYKETSAKDDSAVDNSFEYLVDQCLEQRLKNQLDRTKPQPTFANRTRGVPLGKDRAAGGKDKEGTCKC